MYDTFTLVQFHFISILSPQVTKPDSSLGSENKDYMTKSTKTAISSTSAGTEVTAVTRVIIRTQNLRGAEPTSETDSRKIP